MDLLNYGLKALRGGHHIVSDIMSEMFLTNDEDGQGYVGLENLGNTCYFNSVVQALYFCAPFRNKLLQYSGNGGSENQNNNLLTCLADLFHLMDSKKMSHISPRRFRELVMEANEIFSCSEVHHDAHEFLIFLLNNLEEEITISNKTESPPPQNEETEAKYTESSSQNEETEVKFGTQGDEKNNDSSTIREIFGGTFTNETRCSCCESVTCREEPFMDLSVEIQENSSLSSCLNEFGGVEKLFGENKYWCDKCCHLQEAEKRLRIKSPPQVLICQLKRFKYTQEGEVQGFKKLFYCVAFPIEFRLPVNSRGDEGADDPLYSLFAVVVHVGRTVNYGHYIVVVKSGGQWLKFDDEKVETMKESELHNFFGSSETAAFVPKNAMNAYILFYQAVNCIETTETCSTGTEEEIAVAVAKEENVTVAVANI